MIVVQAGEASKSLEVYGDLQRDLARRRVRRTSRIWAIGGGVIGDLAGFVAATHLRGVEFVQVPTSLLAMVDSSVGGKVGIDLPEGKNLVGAFWPPAEVRVCPDVLVSLPDREFINGTAEIWKAAWIADGDLLADLESAPIAPNDPRTSRIIQRSIEIKAEIVEADEYELNGLRATLNCGHTVGHAIETVLNYDGLLHGEAVAIGMVFEAKLGEQLGVTPPGLADRIAAGLERQGLPIRLPADISPHSLLQAMQHDKKADAQGHAFSLITGLGACKLTRGVSDEAVLSVLTL